MGAAQGQRFHPVLFIQMRKAETFQTFPYRVQPYPLKAAQGDGVQGNGNRFPDSRLSAVLPGGVADGGPVRIRGGGVVKHHAQGNRTAVQRFRVLSHHFDRGAGLAYRGNGAVQRQTGRFFAPAPDDGFHRPGGRFNHDGGGLRVPFRLIDFLFANLLKDAVPGGLNGQSLPVNRLPGVIFRAVAQLRQIFYHLCQRRVLKIGENGNDAPCGGLLNVAVNIFQQSRVVFRPLDQALFQHPGEDQPLAFPVLVRIVQRIVGGGVARNGGDRGTFRKRQRGDFFAEIALRGGLDAPCSRAQIDGIQIVFQNPRLRGVFFQPPGQILFLQFALDLVGGGLFAAAHVEDVVFNELLGDGTGPLREAAGGNVADDGPRNAQKIHPVVLVEALILNGDKGVLQVPWDFVDGDIDAVGLLTGQNENHLSGVVQHGGPVAAGNHVLRPDVRGGVHDVRAHSRRRRGQQNQHKQHQPQEETQNAGKAGAFFFLFHCTLLSVRKARKKSDRTARHSAPKIPPTSAGEWGKRSKNRLVTPPQAPNASSLAPYQTRRTRPFRIAPAHMGHGSKVT